MATTLVNAETRVTENVVSNRWKIKVVDRNSLSCSENKLEHGYIVSSVLNRDTKQFGKKYLFDAEEDTCWNSDQGSPQWIHVQFPEAVTLQEMHIRFQGGFAGKECWIEVEGAENKVDPIKFYPEDSNSLQRFPFPENLCCTSVKIVFNTSTDFYGRVTVYQLNLLGVT
ncbi:nuclear receptor 2C2-associated protein-like [Liolophura sinensis]|uniref:nuclear receptor 2C2-associated protein-like n=1 Tax=Liolophura sinensis TaxID=3198878 RepID=UPI00315950DF